MSKFIKGNDGYYGSFNAATLEALEMELTSVKLGLEEKLKHVKGALLRKQYPTEESFIKEVKRLVTETDRTYAAAFVSMWCDCTMGRGYEIVSQIIEEGIDKEAFDKELRLLISSGRNIDAIKRYRDVFCVCLTDARRAIEKMQEDMAKEARKEFEKRREKVKTMSDSDLLEHLSNIGFSKANQ